jgi:hypothetical protein
MAIEIRNLQGKTELLHHLIPASPVDAKALEDATRGPFEDHTAKEIQTSDYGHKSSSHHDTPTTSDHKLGWAYH